MALTFAKTSFRVERGLTWSEEVTILQSRNGPPVDLTGKTPVMAIRRKISDATPVMLLSADNGRIVVSDAAAGKVRILVSADATLEFPLNRFRKAKYVYDWLLLSGNAPEVREPGTSGTITVKHTTTRPWE